MENGGLFQSANSIGTSWGVLKRGTDGNLGEFVAQFLWIGFELLLNVCNGDGRDRGELVGLFLERTGSGDRGRNGCEKRTHKDQRGAQSFIKPPPDSLVPRSNLSRNPTRALLVILEEGWIYRRRGILPTRDENAATEG